MGTKNKAVAVAMLCVLAMAAAPSSASGVKLRSLLAEENGDGKPDVSHKADPSPHPISPPSGSSTASGQNKSSTPQTDQSPPKSNNSDSTSLKSSPLGDNSANLVPPPAQESKSPETRKQGDDLQGAPKKDDHQTSETTKKGDEKPGQSPEKEGHKASPSSEMGDGKAPQASKKNNLPDESEGTSKSGKGDHSSKNERCDTADASNSTCHKGVLVACILQSGNQPRENFVLVQNTGKDDLKVNLSNPDDIKIGSEMLNLPKYSTKKINFTADTSRSLKIILNAGEGDCLLQTRTSISSWLPFQQFPAYAAQVRPMHGAFFIFATIVIIGGALAYCKFGKRERRVDAGIPYQQLEMSTQTQSASVAGNEIAADTWDESWDDNWDDEEAVIRTSGKTSAENGSSNGISSGLAKANKDGWDIDWDD